MCKGSTMTLFGPDWVFAAALAVEHHVHRVDSGTDSESLLRSHDKWPCACWEMESAPCCSRCGFISAARTGWHKAAQTEPPVCERWQSRVFEGDVCRRLITGWVHSHSFPCACLQQGKCFPCANGQCPLMGHSADKFTVTDGLPKTQYFLNTGSSAPFGRRFSTELSEIRLVSTLLWKLCWL